MIVKDSVEGVAKGIEVMLSNEQGLTAMGNKLKDYVADNFLWANIAKQHELLFKKYS